MNIYYRLTLLLMCNFHDALCLQRLRPPTIWIHHNFNCHINEKKTPKTCLTNHKNSISHHITPLVINSLGGRHTHASILTSWTKAISRNQSHASLCLARTWFKNKLTSYKVFVNIFLYKMCLLWFSSTKNMLYSM